MKYRTTSDRRKGAAISSFSDLPSLFPFNPNPIRSRSNPNSSSVPSATSTTTQLLYQTQCITVYRFNRAFKLTAFGGVDNTISTRFILPEMKKLSTGVKFGSLAELLRNRVKSKLEELNHICTATNGGEFRFCGN
ncbi:unnamed protein product [Lactuca virosa]|uniref:DUF7651 domain-containing protein n=1 Tax=Lactuca virosa TaxID=75947 RepID=A0AAU9MZA3_9ASTR|nr:unnamed protein product [Lactuca virosa]